MFTLRYFSTNSSDWQEACRSDDPRLIMNKFDEVAGQRTVPALELIYKERVVVRLGLVKSKLMRVAVWGQQLRTKPEATKIRFFKYRTQGVKAVKAGRFKVLDALVV